MASYGVGMPIIAYLSAQITSSEAFIGATRVTVNSSPAEGAWNFQRSAIYPDYPIEAHYRLQDYWPAHAAIRVDLPLQGLRRRRPRLRQQPDPRHIDRSPQHQRRSTESPFVWWSPPTTDLLFNFPVSLGKAGTPTFNGTKIVMEKNKVEEMINTTPGQEYDLKVPWSVRITNSGEFIHSASWNGGNIGQRSTSHGCTNLTVTDAEKYFNFAQIGDVTVYTNTGGATMPSWDGYGDWNVPWGMWRAGGLIPTK